MVRCNVLHSRSCVRYEKHYGLPIGRKKGAKVEKTEEETKKKSRKVLAKIAARKPFAPVDPKLEDQFVTGRLYGKLNCRHVDMPFS